jgi:ABC-type transport system involved in multi-copper enzyme maturation permease subunit
MELTDNISNVIKLNWLTGPILDKELRVCSRRKRYYWLRGLYLLAMAMLVTVTWLGSNASLMFQGNAFTASRMSEVGRDVITSIVWFQFFIAQIAAILFFSNSICQEINQGTLNVLMATPITSLQIVMGKLLSRLIQLILILCLSLSTIAIVYVFGGVDWEYIISTFS